MKFNGFENAALADLLGDDESVLDYFPDADATAEYTCLFCKKQFTGDADTAEFRHFNRTYGCGCVPDVIIDEANNRKIDLVGKKVTAEETATWGAFAVKIDGKLAFTVEDRYGITLRDFARG